MREVESAAAAVNTMNGIARKVFVIAIVVPPLLFAVIALDGISWTDVGVTAFAAVVLWLMAGITRFTAGALDKSVNPPEP